LQIGATEEGHLHGFFTEGGEGYVEGGEVLGEFLADEDDAMGCKECLSLYRCTVPLSYFLPRLSILTSNCMF
jgi:hypothetical protein